MTTVIIVIFLVILFLQLVPLNYTEKEIRDKNRMQLLEKADIMSRKTRYETRSFATRIHQAVDKCFDDFKIIDNLILEDEAGVEHQIPLLCATSKGVILFQTVDYPGKGLFGNIDDENWQIAQSADMAQTVPNAAVLGMQNALLIKRITGIDVKPITVISQYTPAEREVLTRNFGLRVISEEKLDSVLTDMAKHGKQNYPPEFLTQVKEKLLAINVSDEDEEEEDVDEDVNPNIPNSEVPAEENPVPVGA